MYALHFNLERFLHSQTSTMSKLKFAANLSFFFAKETNNLAERYALARQHGFRWVECAFPYVVPLADLKKAKEEAGVEQLLINTYPGDTKSGEFGFAALPNKTTEFKDSLEKAIEYAKALDCQKIHIMSGCRDESFTEVDMEKTYLSSLKYAADRLEKERILALIEPINNYGIPGYFMNSPNRAFGYINQIKHPNLKLQLDIFHLQMLEGNLSNNIEKYWPVVDHIQIAQAPNRTEPMLAGEISYPYVFKLLEKLKYDGYIGLEHLCTGETTSQALGWIKDLGYEI